MVKKLMLRMLFVAVATSSVVAHEVGVQAGEYNEVVEHYVEARLKEEALHNPHIALAMQTAAEKRKLIVLGVASLVVVGAVAVACVYDVWPFNGQKDSAAAGKQEQGNKEPGVEAGQVPQQPQPGSAAPSPAVPGDGGGSNMHGNAVVALRPQPRVGLTGPALLHNIVDDRSAAAAAEVPAAPAPLAQDVPPQVSAGNVAPAAQQFPRVPTRIQPPRACKK